MGKSKMIALAARISGEMQVADVPVAPWANVDALKVGDDDPCEVVMAVPAGKSTRNWNYTSNALQSIVGEVNSVGLPAFLGHQKAEDVATEFPNPVTHWIGAKMQDGVAYFRGLIDKSAPDLKRWVRGNAVNQVSIYGYPQLQQNAVTGETDVTDYKALSIDWTPLNRAGMPTSVAAISGEMDTIAQPADASHEALRETLRNAAYNKLSTGNNNDYVSMNSVYDNYFIAGFEPGGTNVMKYYKIPYAKSPEDGNIIIGEPVAVQRKESWEPVSGEMETKGANGMKTELKALLDAGTITAADLTAACGEMGAPAGEKPATGDFEKACGEMFGGKSGAELIAAIKGAAGAAAAQDEKAKDEFIGGIVSSKVSGEMAQGLVKKMLRLPENPTKEQVAGEIDGILADPSVKAILAQAHVDAVPPVSTPTGSDATSGLFVTRRNAL